MVNICCACNEKYARPLSVCLYSLLCNADKTRLYDIVILHSELSQDSIELFRRLEGLFPNCSIRTVDMSEFHDSVKDATNAYITAETNYRLAILGEFFAQYDRVLYLDCDTIVEGDVSELFDTDLCGNAVGGAEGVEVRVFRQTKKGFFIDNYPYNFMDYAMRKHRKNSWGMDAVNALRDGISYFYIGYMAVTRAITVGDFSMCVSAASTLYWSLYGIVSGVQDVSQKCAYAHRYIEFLRFPAAMVKGTKPVKPGEHTIEFRHVSFKYPRSEKLVLRDINLTIKSGEHLSIVGLNGAGKTTFIKLLCRLYDVTEGEILVDGVNIKEYPEEEYRRLFSVVFQDFQLFAFSLRENIAFGEQADDKELERVLKLAGLWEDAQKLPNGLDTMLYKSFDENGTDLSGGQRQKTAIARGLYRNAPVVILDEPTAALDPVAEYEIYRQFNTLVGGKTAVYISHRLSSCKFCDRIVVFADDTIKENGTHEQLVGIDGGIYAGMFAEQAKYYAEG